MKNTKMSALGGNAIMHNVRWFLFSLALGLFLGGGLIAVNAWTDPTLPAPGGNVGAPINTSGIGQSKVGGLILNTGGAVNGLIVQAGNVGIGTTAPTQKLDVIGNVRATDVCTTSGVCLSGAGGVPSKAVMAFYQANCPAGWILANGSNGTPDLRGAFVRGLDLGRGLDSGRTLGSFQADSIESHRHQTSGFYSNLQGSVGAYLQAAGPSSYSNDYNHPDTSSFGGVETRPMNVALIYCMKN